MAEDTTTEQPGNGLPAHLRDDLKWKPGQSGNPAGRPKGARSRLSEAFFNDLDKAWQENGPEVFGEMMRERPHEFAKMIASLQSKEITGEDGGDIPVTHKIVLEGVSSDDSQTEAT